MKRGMVVLLAAIAGMAAAITLATGAVRAQSPQTPADQPKGTAEITVVMVDGKKFATCAVYARNRTFTIASAAEVSVAEGLPADQRIAITADAVVGEGAAATRYVGVTETSLEPDAVKKVKVTLKPIKDIDSYCHGCHPMKKERFQEGQIIRDIHVTGKEIPGKYLERVRLQNTEAERLRREGKPANLPILLEERIVKVAGKEVRKYFYTCESCHTPHAVTPFRKYARAEYIEKSDLCIGCHL